jgi:hypothetical protein
MNKHLYVDSTGRVCRIDAETGAMIPIEWETKEEADAKRFQQGKADLWAFGAQHVGTVAEASVIMVGDAIVRVTQDGRIQYWNGDVEDDKA